MEGIINTLKNLFSTYGFQAAAIIILTIIIVNLIKKPITKKAVAIAEKTGLDKSIITKHISVLPVIVAFVLNFTYAMIAADGKFKGIDFGVLFSSAVVYGAIAIATYETVKKQLKAYASKENAQIHETENKIDIIEEVVKNEDILP